MIANIINVVEPMRQPEVAIIHMKNGKKINCPVELALPRMPSAKSAPGDEPAVADCGGQHRTDTAGAETDNDTPDQKELPELVHHHRAADTGDQQSETAEHDFARAKAVD